MSDHFGTLYIKGLRHAVITLSSMITNNSIYAQKQPPEVFYKKRCSKEFHKIHRKTPVPGSLF